MVRYISLVNIANPKVKRLMQRKGEIMGKVSMEETRFFFGGKKQIILLILSILLFAILPNVLVISQGINTLTLLVSVFSVCLGAFGILYYSGYYHKWLHPTLISLIFFEGYNSGREGCMKHLKELFSNAQEEILILSGRLRSDFYELDDAVQTFEEALRKGIRIKILVGKSLDCQTKRIPKLLKEYASNGSALRMYCYPSPKESPTPHFMVADKRNCRIEEFHDEGSSLDNIEAPPIVWHNEELAGGLARQFNNYWSVSSFFPVDDNDHKH